jgi:hypothetical protein
MEFDRQKAYDQLGLREERENEIYSERPLRMQYSVRTLLLLVVPISILASAFRWLIESGYIIMLLPTFLLGAAFGGSMAFSLGFWSFVLGTPDGNNRFFWDWVKYVFWGALYSGVVITSLFVLFAWLVMAFI